MHNLCGLKLGGFGDCVFVMKIYLLLNALLLNAIINIWLYVNIIIYVDWLFYFVFWHFINTVLFSSVSCGAMCCMHSLLCVTVFWSPLNYYKHWGMHCVNLAFSMSGTQGYGYGLTLTTFGYIVGICRYVINWHVIKCL